MLHSGSTFSPAHLGIQLDDVLAEVSLNILEEGHGPGTVHQVDGQPVLTKSEQEHSFHNLKRFIRRES